MGHKQFREKGTTQINRVDHALYESLDDGKEYVLIKDPVTRKQHLIRSDVASKLKSEYAYPEFHPLIEESLERFLDKEFMFQDDKEQLANVRSFLRDIFKFASTRIGDPS